ncbi:asparagine synthase [Methanocella paludicola SANAE]|uniref:Putative asparagine synthetase [glutamine-hydrolyzing] n=1 Tax=Methanocella paludicola (strain DSM 17711 / JCM 13418 / NBRC 101707 / SANAE) TaxID=304371 RepID=D1Z1D8_METPS|nr:asparagine synthetase B [Methanocella paludicola]BAI62510.1 asparagine synthase [Methanocella paludicola SANAE]
MCGIGGFSGAEAGPKTAEIMRLIRHRGPDGERVWEHGTVCMGHVHLKVTGDARQPVALGDRAFTYNGEIYNFREFITGESDTMALAGILRDGMEGFMKAAPDIDGEYAFAYYDGSRLALARDPVGIKPLYYGKSEQGFGFASERKALVHTGIKDIRTLAPGHIYYDGEERPAAGLPRHYPVIKDEDEAINALDGALAKSIEQRRHSDAAVAFSGGVDCALVGAISGLPLCTVGLKGSYDVRAAKKAAELMGAEKRHVVYEYDERDVEEALPRVVYAVESADPVKISIALPLFILAERARHDGYRVLLSGQGADELFGGYARHEAAAKKGRLAEALEHDLEHIAEVNLERDDAATMAHGVELRVPYLGLSVIRAAQKMDTSLKVHFDGKDYIRKYVLRKMSEKYLSREVAYAPKKAIQYGTGTQKTLERLASKRNFKGIRDHLQSLYGEKLWP